MPKKNMTEEEKKAWGAKMKALRDAKKEVVPQDNILSNEEISDLLRRVKELESRQFTPQPGFNPQGGMVGTLEKYTVNPKYYPDPTERLAREAKLQRFAFPINYELKFDVAVTSYQTKDGVNTREPRFTLELHRIVMDEDTGQPTDGRYVISRAVFHEDPQAALIIAREQGFDVDTLSEKDFLDEMRYLRIRDWLFDVFYAPKNTGAKKNKKDMVIGNKLVEYFEISSENSESMPFNQLNTKL